MRPEADGSAADGRHPILAPLVGTFYRAPEPGAKPFVEEGDVVDEGQSVAIVEAMKLMNQVVADQGGRVAEILVKDGDWVEFEQVLMYLEPHRRLGVFEKVLIANRGEIALRVARACRELGIRSVAVHSTADADSAAVRFADEAVQIGPPASGRSYLHIPSIIGAARKSGADAIHPGYGFLSEDPYFAEICFDEDITFIGPRPEVMEKVGRQGDCARPDAAGRAAAAAGHRRSGEHRG